MKTSMRGALWCLSLVMFALSPQAYAEHSFSSLGLDEVVALVVSEDLQRCLPAEGSQVDAHLTQAQQALLACMGLDPRVAQAQQQLADHPHYSQLYGANAPWRAKNTKEVTAFEDLLGQVLSAGLSTGYNIVPQDFWPQFDPSRTVVYGHSDWQHARQLVALLDLKGLSFSMKAVSKVSAFVYRDDWGEPDEPLRTLANGQRLAQQVEYDLVFEFANVRDMERFSQLITRYAKKDHASEQGLLHGAWWQPFYRSFVARAEAPRLTMLLVTYRGLRANLIAMPAEAASKMQQVQAISDDWRVQPVPIWVNPAFFRFQQGDFR